MGFSPPLTLQCHFRRLRCSECAGSVLWCVLCHLCPIWKNQKFDGIFFLMKIKISSKKHFFQLLFWKKSPMVDKKSGWIFFRLKSRLRLSISPLKCQILLILHSSFSPGWKKNFLSKFNRVLTEHAPKIDPKSRFSQSHISRSLIATWTKLYRMIALESTTERCSFRCVTL